MSCFTNILTGLLNFSTKIMVLCNKGTITLHVISFSYSIITAIIKIIIMIILGSIKKAVYMRCVYRRY
jgi:hypothetical protein